MKLPEKFYNKNSWIRQKNKDNNKNTQLNRINDSLGCFYLEEILFTKNYRKDDKRYAFSAQVNPIYTPPNKICGRIVAELYKITDVI